MYNPLKMLSNGQANQAEAAIKRQADKGWKHIRSVKPNKEARRFVKAMRESKLIRYEDIAEKAGLKLSDLYNLARDRKQSAWILQNACETAQFRLGECYLALANQASTSDKPAWAEIMLRRFDPDYQRLNEKKDGDIRQNVQINHFNSYTWDELVALAKSKERKVLGEAAPQMAVTRDVVQVGAEARSPVAAAAEEATR